MFPERILARIGREPGGGGIQRILCGLLLAAIFIITGCTPAYTITPLKSTAARSDQAEVEILSAAPSRPYDIVAKFRGNERRGCPEKRPYCTLRDEARKAGADAAWIQSRSVIDLQDEWIMIQGKLTKIERPKIRIFEGVLIRYTD